VIKPTIGRRLWFWPNGVKFLSNGAALSVIHPAEGQAQQPLDAGVVFVSNDRLLNLDVTDHYGHHHQATSVPLLQDDDPVPTSGAYATWMDYQKQQAETAPAAPASSGLLPHQQRVVAEKARIDSDLQKLRTFVESGGIFLSLPAEEQQDLLEQSGLMAQTSAVLARRIARFG